MEQLKTIHNGERVRSTFSASEMNRRLGALRAHMAERQIDACLFTSIHNIHYFSDFLYCSFGRLYGLVVTQEGQTTISANIDGGQPWRRTFGDNVAYTDWHRDNYFVAVKQLIQDGGRIGIEFDHITVENLRKLQGALPAAELIDVSKPTMRMRMVKSDEEIAWISRERPHRRHRRRGRPGGNRRGRAGVRGGIACDPGHGARDRQQPAPCGADGYLDLVFVRHQHRWCPQSRYIAQDRARRHSEPELLSHAGRLLHGARAYALRRRVLGRVPASVEH